MITVDELRAQRDAVFSQQLAAVESAIDATVLNLNAQGLRTYTWISTTTTQVQMLWLEERYRSLGYVSRIETSGQGGFPGRALILHW